jgi:hypothetical protein
MWNTECRRDADAPFALFLTLPNLREQFDRQEAGRDNPQAVLPQAVLP